MSRAAIEMTLVSESTPSDWLVSEVLSPRPNLPLSLLPKQPTRPSLKSTQPMLPPSAIV
jgi:hypothetical protein